ncbi:hypothetical protein [Sandaracinus amylolyticus]|uniref:hypothetical protein n=1 Tax=Sandaracinus amylolyticus TaxID=927083 RepID=UPI001F0A3F3D|nr:hypothetical protein [Sandaracinus amylolyticus]
MFSHATAVVALCVRSTSMRRSPFRSMNRVLSGVLSLAPSLVSSWNEKSTLPIVSDAPHALQSPVARLHSICRVDAFVRSAKPSPLTSRTCTDGTWNWNPLDCVALITGADANRAAPSVPSSFR